MKHFFMYRLGASLTVLMLVSNIACAQQVSALQAQQGAVQHRHGDAIENACPQELRRIARSAFRQLSHGDLSEAEWPLLEPCFELSTCSGHGGANENLQRILVYSPSCSSSCRFFSLVSRL